MKRKLFYAVLTIAILIWAFYLPLSPNNNSVNCGNLENRFTVERHASSHATTFYAIRDKETGCMYLLN